MALHHHLGGGRVAGRGRRRTVHGDRVPVCGRWDNGRDMVGRGMGKGKGSGAGSGSGRGLGLGFGEGAPRNVCSWSATSSRQRGSPRYCQCPCPNHCQND